MENTMEVTKAIEKIMIITLDGDEPLRFFCKIFNEVSIMPDPIKIIKGINSVFNDHFSPFL
jgi:hypothetical protein